MNNIELLKNMDIKKALNAKHSQRPRVITIDKYPAIEVAIIDETYYGDKSCTTKALDVSILKQYN